ncbi:MAG TPA: sialidase family protein [Solirubrobacteraceae bacterium]|jgi:hypothetical protein
MRIRLFFVAVLTLAGLAPATQSQAAMRFRTVKLPGIDGSGTEPRITVGPDDVRWAMTNEKRGGASNPGPALVFKSVDEGQTWQKVTDPPQASASIDVDIVAMRTGRILESELDYGGINFPSAVTDDGGKTWKETQGSNRLADQDRQWFAVGPDDPETGKPRVYLLYHNLASGFAQHNMWVATSTDGGETFGPPVPTTVPGQQAYADLQCADSGGPSSIAVNPKTGRIYVVFTTRSGPGPGGEGGEEGEGGVNFGGCGATPLEFNIVNGTRVWVTTSPDGTAGTWEQSLAVDDSTSGHVVSMQLAYGALDNQGGMYVAYPESPRPYPDLSGAAVRLRWQDPQADGTLRDDKWSAPVTLVPPMDKGGNNLVHLAVGDPGKIAVAYYHGIEEPGVDAPVWYTHVAESRNVRSTSPTVEDQRVSEVPTHKWTASRMMGICHDEPGIGGVLSGVDCDRSTDVWGIALDRSCRLSIVWPTSGKNQDGTTAGLPGDAPGTYVSTQTDDSPGLCEDERSLPGSSPGAFLPPGPPPEGVGTVKGRKPSCLDRRPPESNVFGRISASRRGVSFRGLARDRGCSGVRNVRVSIALTRSPLCRFLRGNGTFAPSRSCRRTSYLPAVGGKRFRYRFRGRLPRGRYFVWTRGYDNAGNVERKHRKRNLRYFVVR